MMNVREGYYEIPVGEGYVEVSGSELIQSDDEHLDQLGIEGEPLNWTPVKMFDMAGYPAEAIFGGITDKVFRFRRKAATVE